MNEMSIGIQRLADTTSEIAESSSAMTGLVETSVSHSQEVVSQIQNVESSVLRTANHVEEMGDKFRSIEEMVTIITSIADQTNLLALNAAIEAEQEKLVKDLRSWQMKFVNLQRCLKHLLTKYTCI